MTWWLWLLIIYGIGIPISGALNVIMLVGSGGYVSYPMAIVRNAFLWPIMLPVLVGMWIQSHGQ